MDSKSHKLVKEDSKKLFDRVVFLLEQARTSVVRSVNSHLVVVYWLIGREIVDVIQSGEERAKYGKQVMYHLSQQLNVKFGTGFSVPNLRNFRQFYQVYQDRLIHYPEGSELEMTQKQYPGGSEFKLIENSKKRLEKSKKCFNSQLNWSHYRALMRVNNPKARDFYEIEAAECGWSKTQLERQIHTSYFERIIKNNGTDGLLPKNRDRLNGEILDPVHTLKSPYVLEFLDLPDTAVLHENDLEKSIIKNLQSFLLELGKGFSFVFRQKHIRFDDDDFYVDLVFYNYIIKCFLLVDLKIGKLTHRDVGQMDGYVRLFENRFKVQGDNPTIGLILCSDKSEAVAKYSVLKENKQLFAAKYMDFLPTEEELRLEIEKERKLIEEAYQENEESETKV